MKNKRILALVFSLVTVFSLTACRGNDSTNPVQENTSANTVEEVGSVASDDITSGETTLFFDSEATAPETTEESSEEESVTETEANDPVDWSTERIVDAYKNAAKKSNAKTKSNQIITLKSISVNNGEYEGLFEFITPIMSKLLANNSKETNGITGGYNNLVVSDVASAKAYKSGSYTAIELVMREQTSGANDNALAGSVGHAITAVGDISVVTKQLTDLGIPLELSEKDTKIYYTAPVVRVLINDNGEIVNGTWRYTVEISLNNYKAFGKAVNTTSVIMDNTITVNGGFRK